MPEEDRFAMVYIKKRDGRDEPFMPEKITASLLKCGLSEEDADMIVSEISKRAGWGMTTKEIRSEVIRMMRELNPEYEQKWLDYERNCK